MTQASNKPLSSDNVDMLVETARQQIALVGRLRAALEAGDDRRALSLARIIAGLTAEIKPQTAA